jgi:TFIIF-interacting CTD phosphatase-like protein
MVKNILLDLDNTLISAEPITDFPFTKEGMREKAMNFPIHNMDGYYIVFERPDLQDFLDYLFSNYNVAVWTAASKDYAIFIVEHILLKKPNRTLDFILFSYHGDIAYKKHKGTKNLKLIWDTLELDGYTPDNTIIIDDLKDVYDTQPTNAINIKAFEILDDGSEHDKELLDVVTRQLEMMKE